MMSALPRLRQCRKLEPSFAASHLGDEGLRLTMVRTPLSLRFWACVPLHVDTATVLSRSARLFAVVEHFHLLALLSVVRISIVQTVGVEHRRGGARHGGDPGAAHFQDPERFHDFEECVDLALLPGKFDDHGVRRHVQYLRPEDLHGPLSTTCSDGALISGEAAPERTSPARASRPS